MALFSVSPGARAAAKWERVAIVCAEDIDDRRGVVHDLELEFRAEGLDVRLVGKEADSEPFDVWVERARVDGEGALVHVVLGASGGASIDVLMVMPESLVLKDTIRRQASDTSDMAAVRAVEIARAALIDVQEARRAQWEGDVDIVRDNPYPSQSPFVAVSVSPVLAITGNEPLTLIDLGINLSWLPSQQLALELEGAFPLTAGVESGNSTTAQVKVTFMDLGASFFFVGKDAAFRPYVALRGGGVVFSTTAGSSVGFNGMSQDSLSFFSTFAAGASIALQGIVRLRVEAGVGVMPGPPILQINGQGVDHLGLPLTLLRIGPEAAW